MHYMPLRAVLFDLDDTLFDHDRATECALAVLRAEEPALTCWSAAELSARHRAVLEAMHADVLAGRASIETARAERFRRLLEDAMGAAAPIGQPTALAERYRQAYESAWQPVAGATALLSAIRAAGLRIAVVTNNLIVEQTLKLRRCALDVFVDALVTSEDAGAAKPDARIFEAALDRLGLTPAQAVMVGDAWSTDIEGALAAGIRPVWFNPQAAPNPNPAVAELTALEPTEQAVRVIRGC